MKKRTSICAIALTLAAVTGLAHDGAADDVKERMAGMSAMQKQIKVLVPIMRGLADYDADAIRAAADIVIAHSGDAMTTLFPEGSNLPPSEALGAIWDEWDEFAALAEDLATAAEGMKRAADNGLGDSGAGRGSGMTAGNGTDTAPDVDALADMPVNAAFAAMTRTCSDCHSKFRAERG